MARARNFDLVETVCRSLNRTRLAEVTGEALSVVSLILSNIRHVGRDIHQANNRWIRARLRNYGSPIAVRDKDARSVLHCEDTLHGGYIARRSSSCASSRSGFAVNYWVI